MNSNLALILKSLYVRQVWSFWLSSHLMFASVSVQSSPSRCRVTEWDQFCSNLKSSRLSLQPSANWHYLSWLLAQIQPVELVLGILNEPPLFSHFSVFTSLDLILAHIRPSGIIKFGLGDTGQNTALEIALHVTKL